ncbi:MAG: GNAT family N-acetyltransferase [Betaproteobacteria bacterium]
MTQLAFTMSSEGLPSYETHYTFTAAKYDECTWQRLLPDSLEGYRYHLAFELGCVEGFKTGYISVSKAGAVVCIAPIFITNYALDTTVQGRMKAITRRVSQWLPSLMTVRLLCVGSPVTDSAQIGFFKDQPLDAEMIRQLSEKLNEVADREGASVIAFKDVLAAETNQLQPLLEAQGYSCLDNMPVAKNSINFKDLDDYISTLSASTRKDLRRKLKKFDQLRIEEHDGLPPHLEQIYQLYLNCYEKSELKFERLTLAFFESLAGLMPMQCRFVLYYFEDKLIGFNCLLHGNGVLMDKYIGMDYLHSTQVNLYSLSWLYKIKMCIRDGFHTLQSGQAAYESKLSFGATLEQTHILFKHRNKLINPILKLAAHALAYGNFDPALKALNKKSK